MVRIAGDVSSLRSQQLVTASTTKLSNPSAISPLLHYLFPTSSVFGLPSVLMLQSFGILPPKPGGLRQLTAEVWVPSTEAQEVQALARYLQDSTLLAEIR